MFVRFHRSRNVFVGRVKNLCMSDCRDRCFIAGTHARRANDPNVFPEFAGKISEQFICARHAAG
jgi:hypothetical protein